ncbi:MAG: hypothetical protein JW969_21325 [Spirochaetales bacterium]|nr:hypothetical protein [Spirochaetales bacterium]
MSENPNFQERLDSAIQKKKQDVEVNTLFKLKEHFAAFQAYFENVYNIFLRKGLIQEDPYKHDEKISEVRAPEDDVILESEKVELIGKKLSEYHSQLDFLNTYYQFSITFLNLKRLKGIMSLMKYINWLNCSISSTHPLTKTIAELVAKIKMGSDTISSQIITDALGQLEKNARNIFIYLDETIAFLREYYKYEIRTKILPEVNFPQFASRDDTELIKAVKVLFSTYMQGKGFYPELIREIHAEEFGEDSAKIRESIFRKLNVKEKEKKKEKKKTDYKTMLLQGVRILSSAGFQMEDAINKLNENNSVYKSRKMSLGERFTRWLRKVILKQDDTLTYEIEYFDVLSSANRTEKIHFDYFVEELQKRAKLFLALSNKASGTYGNLEKFAEEKIYEFLTKNIAILQLMHRRMSGLDDFFRNEVPKDKKAKVRGIKVELTAVKNSLIKANKKKHEYVSFKEEEEQMKRLGIKTE